MNRPDYCGIIMNYVCTAACRHCMFGSAPGCGKEFISAEMAEETAEILEKARTRAVHIGGGEPFMNFPALCTLIEALNRHGIGVDYIETNAFWAKDEEIIKERLLKLRYLGVDTIMVSVDPFHIEFVPLERPILLCRMLEKCGFDYFIWKDRYIRPLMKLDMTKTHTKEELMQVLGKNYITDTAAEYGVGMNGRALAIAKDIFPAKPAEKWITKDPCSSLLDTCHCHFDLYGNAVPSGCPGISAETEDYLTENIPAEKYPVLSRLYNGGTAALYEYAKAKGFVPAAEGYPSKCAFCYAMRSYLVSSGNKSADLSPVCFYEQIDKIV